MKHTPGPWTIYKKTCVTIQNTLRARPSDNEWIVEPMGPNAEADAQLIAAAPELLEALEMLVDAGALNKLAATVDYDFVLKVLEKARGQFKCN